MMHLIHRNRVDHFAGIPRNISPLRSDLLANIFPSGARLVIGVDGIGHETLQGEQKDQIRTERPEEYGLTVIRVPNRCIDDNFYGVCKYIDQIVQERRLDI